MEHTNACPISVSNLKIVLEAACKDNIVNIKTVTDVNNIQKNTDFGLCIICGLNTSPFLTVSFYYFKILQDEL